MNVCVQKRIQREKNAREKPMHGKKRKNNELKLKKIIHKTN
jgi:hypothetical protein